MIYLDNLLIGDTNDLLNWASQTYNYEDFRSEMVYESLRQQEYQNYFQKSKVKDENQFKKKYSYCYKLNFSILIKNDFVYMDITSNNQNFGRLLIEVSYYFCLQGIMFDLRQKKNYFQFFFKVIQEKDAKNL